MSEVIITPELTLQLQQAAREAGFVEQDISLLANSEQLTKILPILSAHADVQLRNVVAPFARVSSNDQFRSVAGAVQHLYDRGVKLSHTAKQLAEEGSYVAELAEAEAYDLYLLSGTVLGLPINGRFKRALYETRAAAYGFELGPPILAIYALHNDNVFNNCHVATLPFSDDEYSAQYFYIRNRRDLATEIDVLDEEAARNLLLAEEAIPTDHQWLFFKRV